MAIEIRQDTMPQLFSSTHYIVDQTQDGKWHWTLSGIARANLTVPSGPWKETADIMLVFPGTGPKYVAIEQWAPFVTTSMNYSTIDAFRLRKPDPKGEKMAIVECDFGGVYHEGPKMYNVGLEYLVHIVGRLVDPPVIG
jgi:hypothetical protein